MNKLWNKYQKPSRWLYAEKSDGTCKATATWVLDNGVWFCVSASHHLRWMMKRENFETVKQRLCKEGFIWKWRPGKPGIKTPFESVTP